MAGTLFLLLQQHGNGTYPKTPGKIEDDPKNPKYIKNGMGEGVQI